MKKTISILGTIFALALAGCSSHNIDTVERYRVETAATAKQNVAGLQLEQKKLDAYVKVATKELESQQAIRMAEIELEKKKLDMKAGSPQDSQISVITEGNLWDIMPPAQQGGNPVSVSGDGNTVVVGSSGAEVTNQEVAAGQEAGRDTSRSRGLLESIGQYSLVPLPQAPVIESPYKPLADFGKTALNVGLKGVLGYAAIDNLGDALVAGASRDSHVGDSLVNSQNPVTTTTTTHAAE